jgi:hypothetical protein
MADSREPSARPIYGFTAWFDIGGASQSHDVVCKFIHFNLFNEHLLMMWQSHFVVLNKERQEYASPQSVVPNSATRASARGFIAASDCGWEGKSPHVDWVASCKFGAALFPRRLPLTLTRLISMFPFCSIRESRGASRPSRALGWNAMDAAASLDGLGWRGQQSRVVLAPQGWRQGRELLFASDGHNNVWSPGRARTKPLKPSRRECR